MAVSSDVVFSPTVKRLQAERGSRDAYAKVERHGGFDVELQPRLLALLARVDTAFLATVNADGQPYLQHRGGPRGFLRAIDEHTLGFADLAGNRQYVTTGNLADDDRVCLFAIDYANRRRVKLWGRARAVPATPELLLALGPVDPDARVEQVILIEVTAWDINCSQHIPQKLDAADVAAALEARDQRIAVLEAELAALRADRA